ncbi:MAG: DUF2132 domain-containing protein [Bdellovibrio sp.]|nr:DUF2132 domain-containing protein [Bdellovibrio sp.]
MQDNKTSKPRKNKYPAKSITSEMMVTRLVEICGWERLGEKITIRYFTQDPSIKSSLKFLRTTPWAREKVENLFRWRDDTGWDPRDNHK